MFDRLMFLKKTCIQGNSVSNISTFQSEISNAISSQLYNTMVEDDYMYKDKTDVLNISKHKTSQVKLFSKRITFVIYQAVLYDIRK